MKLGTKKGNERHTDPNETEGRKRRKGAMEIERPSGDALGNRRHATEGGNIDRKKGS